MSNPGAQDSLRVSCSRVGRSAAAWFQGESHSREFTATLFAAPLECCSPVRSTEIKPSPVRARGRGAEMGERGDGALGWPVDLEPEAAGRSLPQL